VRVNLFKILTPVSYWLLIVMWSFILVFYIRRLRTSRVRLELIGTLIVILSIDAFRTLFESIYFGAWYTSKMGLLPQPIYDYLVLPGNVFVPKAINVIAAVLVITIVLRKWIPQEEAERKRQVAYTTELEQQITERKKAEAALRKHQEQLEGLVHERTVELEQSLDKLRGTLQSTVDALSVIIENRDPYTFGHQKRVAQLACTIAEHLGLSEERLMGIRMAGLLHDLGKLDVPVEILNRPGKLGELESHIIQNHTTVGFEILKGIDFPWPVAQAVYQHHERMDGSGYPQGLAGDEILLEARIIGVADVVESMASNRPYRAAKGLEVALEEIKKGRGKLYDSEVADAALAIFARGYKFDQVEKTA
jgi:putative nucleotidyltransferase with HDIG domain